MTRHHLSPKQTRTIEVFRQTYMACLLIAIFISPSVATSLEQAMAISLFSLAMASLCAVGAGRVRDGRVDLTGVPMQLTFGFLVASIFSAPIVHLLITDPEEYAIYQNAPAGEENADGR